MIKNKTFINFIMVTLMVSFLTISVGKVTPVYALAELAPEFAPIFDTQIYQLQDYIDHGGMSAPQLDIFYMLCGFYALGQAGSEDYKLTNPYSTKGGVLNWLKDIGVETYNTLIGLAPDTVVLPNGSIQSTDVLKKAASLYVADLMGCALKAHQYDTVQEFEDDIDNSTNFYIPWNKSTQYGLNTLYQTYGGIYEWQFKTKPFTSNTTYTTTNITELQRAEINSYLNSHGSSRVRFNYPNTVRYNCLATGGFLDSYTNLFVNTTENCIYLVKDDGTLLNDSSSTSDKIVYIGYVTSSNNVSTREMNTYPFPSNHFYYLYNSASYNTYLDLVKALYNHSGFSYNNPYAWYFFEDFVKHVYVGSSWVNRHEIFNVESLNLDDTGTDYYVTPKDDNDYLLDIKGILLDILNNTDLLNVFIDNIYTPDGVLVHDTDLIRINTSIYELLNQQNPPLPVNLNDIAELTDNSYLERVKEHARNAGDIFANYVAFWHNCDSDLVYTVFGAAILVLVGAFVGKWGHS